MPAVRPHASAARTAALAVLLMLLSAAPAASATPPEPIRPIEPVNGLNPRKVELGRRLFNEPRLSKNGSVSCASCHDFAQGGSDGQIRFVGMGGAEGPLNSPTVFNSGLNFRQFWDGRAVTLADQLDGPLLGAIEMASSWSAILLTLRGDPRYSQSFKAIYREGVTADTVKDALVQFELSLSTPDSRFDRYLRGDATALSAPEQAGYAKFKAYGCTSCHQGVGVGGNMFQTFGVAADYFADRGRINPADLGRFNVTGREEDRYVFKVPSLRNVAVTAPYFHDGSAPSLEHAVAVMGKYQLGRELSRQDIDDIVVFLHTLTGQYEGKSL